MPTPPLDRLKLTADRFLKVTGPPARTVRDRVTREVGRRVGQRLGRGAQDVAPQRDPEPVAREEQPTPGAPATSGPNPASIAKNVAHERPRAKPAAEQPATRRDPEAMPGGKLPPRRPRPA